MTNGYGSGDEKSYVDKAALQPKVPPGNGHTHTNIQNPIPIGNVDL